MENYYIKNEYTLENLVNIKRVLTDQLNQVGALYEERFPKQLTEFQKNSVQNHRNGYDFGEQIYDIYSDMGSVMAAMNQLAGIPDSR